MMNEKPKTFYGWFIVAAGFAMAAAGIGIFNNTLSVFVKPVCEDLGFTRGSFTLYNTVRSMAAMAMMPVFGEIFSRGKNLKRIMVGCALLICAAAFGYSVSSQLWQFYLFALLHGIAMNGVFIMAISTLINNWFKEKKGFALGLALSGSGLGGSVMVPIVTYVIEGAGWRWGYRTMGLAGLGLLLPVLLFVVKIRPSDMGLAPYGAEAVVAGTAAPADTNGFTRGEVLHMPAFYMTLVGFFLAVFTFCSTNAHAVSYLTDIGHSSLFASSVLSASMFVLIGGKIAMGWIIDRFGVRMGSLSMGLAAIAGGFCLLAAGSAPFAYLYAVCLGFGMAFGSVAPSLITTRYFGTRDFARILALLSMADSLGNAASQPFPGFIYDFTGSYVAAWYLCIGLMAVAVVLLLLADRLAGRAWERRMADGVADTTEVLR